MSSDDLARCIEKKPPIHNRSASSPNPENSEFSAPELADGCANIIGDRHAHFSKAEIRAFTHMHPRPGGK